MPSFRLGEKIVRIYNPLPPGDDGELIHSAGLDGLWNASHEPTFTMHVIWSQGPEREELVILPGQFLEVPISLGNFCYSELAGAGLVLITKLGNGEWPAMTSPAVVAKAIEGLQKARQFYAMRGSMPLAKARVRHGATNDEMWEAIRLKFKGGLMNWEKEKRVTAHVQSLAARPRPAQEAKGA